jgi:pre-rRNA-processing protein TSR3
MDVLILRDPRESLAKCSLTPLRGLPGVRFVDFHGQKRVEAGGRTLLHVEGEELTAADRGRELLLVDCSWRRVERCLRSVDGVLHPRRLPPLLSAYPRRSKLFHDPDQGLASVEALYVASLLLGEPRPDFLREYRWREAFLAANRERLAALAL